MVDEKQSGTVTGGMAMTLRPELANSVNLLAHPLAGMAAASAIGIGFASHAFGFWMGTVSGMAEASQRMFAPLGSQSSESNIAPIKVRSAAIKAKTAAKVLIEETQSAAIEIAGDAAQSSERLPVVAGVPAELQPEDFRQPKSMSKPKKVDDLKAIAGIGPKLEKVLNELGVWTYAQVSAWTAEEIAWVDDYLSFKGRIGRDDWIGQAARLSGKKKR